jgi:hypothetical protein
VSVAEKQELNMRTVLLNPIAGDAYSEGDGGLMLDIPVRGRPAIPISDVLWFSSYGDASPVQGMQQPAQRGRVRRPGEWLPEVEELAL